MFDRLRIGLGTDLHRLEEGLPLWIGGVQIESPWGCNAHSDGDALLHAVIDALLGATHLGDIGEHFSPSDAKWKGANSQDLLRHTLEIIHEQFSEFAIINVDMVVHLQAPKLLPYRAAIQSTVAMCLGIATDRVSLKAKTGESLFPVGTHEAIETQVVVLIQV